VAVSSQTDTATQISAAAISDSRPTSGAADDRALIGHLADRRKNVTTMAKAD
jgi:hypothetical protein